MSEIEVLKPDLIVFHGKPAQWVFANAIDNKGYKDADLPNSPKDGNFSLIHEVTAPDGEPKFFVLYLKHPAHGWLKRQWDNDCIVESALELLRSKGAIPPQ